MSDYMPRALPKPAAPSDDPLKCAVTLGNRIRIDKGTEGVQRYAHCMREFLPRAMYESLCRALDLPAEESALPSQPPQPVSDPRMQMLQMLMQFMKNGRPDAQSALGGLPISMLTQLFSRTK